MDKLTIEEKAKRYDEVIGRVANIKTGKCETTFIFTEGLFDYLFPELEECNEEEVREAMIDFFKHEREEGVVVSHYGVNIERMIAWLEKQKAVDILDEEEREFSDNVDSYRKEVDAAYQKGYNEGVKATLEKQDKKPADRVKLMFKVGDWIIYDRHISKVKDMDSEGYLVEDTYGDEGILPKEFAEKHYHLWTIADAKDGDVLADNVGVILFKSIGDNNVINFHAYFSGLFAVQEGEHYWGHIRESTLSPTTKEQRERFFAAMNDAGWEFDFEKKELKKIPQRIISAEAKEAMYGKPTAWSEEDEQIILSIEQAMNCASLLNIVPEKMDKIRTWLKSLKQRIKL